VRDSLPIGPVSLQRVLQVLPFGSSVVTLTSTGQKLLQALENSGALLPARSGRFLQLSGVAVTYDLAAPPGSRVRDVVIGGRPLDPRQRYSVATNAFIADGGDGFSMFLAARDRIDRQLPLRDLLLQALKHGPLTASVDGRIRFITQGGVR
jgi:5'-nucleotidase / UDP-sugar diphosphatase